MRTFDVLRNTRAIPMQSKSKIEKSRSKSETNYHDHTRSSTRDHKHHYLQYDDALCGDNKMYSRSPHK